MKNDSKDNQPKQSTLSFKKETVRLLTVKTDVRAGMLAACSSCPSIISTPSDTSPC